MVCACFVDINFTRTDVYLEIIIHNNIQIIMPIYSLKSNILISANDIFEIESFESLQQMLWQVMQFLHGNFNPLTTIMVGPRSDFTIKRK